MKIRQKVNLLKQGASKAFAFLLIGVLLGSYLSILIPARTAAAAAYSYTNNQYGGISGPLPDGSSQYVGNNLVSSFQYTKDKGGAGKYISTTGQNFNNSGGVCTPYIQTSSKKYDGDKSATTWWLCGSSINSKHSITIDGGSGGGGGGGGGGGSATAQGTWIDHNHIQVGNTVYTDSKIDTNDSYTANASGCSQQNVINGFLSSNGDGSDNPNNATTTAKITTWAPVGAGNSNCTSVTRDIKFSNPNDYSAYFVWQDAGTIQTSDGTAMTFVQNNGNGPFFDDGSGRSSDSTGKCKSQIVPGGSPTQGTLIIRSSSSNPFSSGFSPQIDYASSHMKFSSGCYVSSPISVHIANPNNANQKPAGSANAGAGGNANSDQLGCDASANALSWIICPVTDLMKSAIGVTDDLITQQLTIPTDSIFCDNNDTCNAYYTAWVSFRNIALGLLVVAGMIIVIAQAVGMEILDAYTVRRALPRLLIASLGIILSWTLMNFALTLSNNLGYGVRDLIIAPFHSLNSSISFSGGAAALIGGFAAFLVGLVAIIGAIGILLSYLATAGLAVLIAITVLIIRQLVIIVLIILSPVAIVMYVMPNTQRMFRLWWESFSKALLMFPLIAAFIAAGRVFSAISLTNSQGLFNQLVAFVAYFGPYFAIPLTFRMAGGIMSGVGNFVNQRAQPAMGRLGQYRKDRAVQKLKNARANQFVNEDFGRFGNNRSVGKMANWVALQATDQDELIPWKLGKKRTFKHGPLKDKTFRGVPGLRGYSGDLQDQLDNRAIRESQKGMQEVEQDGKIHYEGWRGVAGDIGSYKGSITRQNADGSTYTVPVSQALSDAGFSATTPPSSITDFQKMGEILQQSDSDKERQGGSDIMSHAGTLAGIKRHEGMEYADTQIMGMVAMAGAGRIEHEPAALIANSLQDRLGHGVAQRALKTAQSAASRVERPDMRDGHAYIRNKDGKWESVFSPQNYKGATAYGNVLSTKSTAWSGAKAESVEAAAPTIKAIANGEQPDSGKPITEFDVKSMREVIGQGVASYYSDPGQRSEWRKIAAQIDDPEMKKLVDAPVMSKEESDARHFTPTEGEAPPPAPPEAPAPPPAEA